MNSRLIDIPVYSSDTAIISAQQYNRARLALIRLDAPIFLHLKPLKHLGLFIEPDAWIVVDEVLNEFPVMAWTEFKTEHRRTLHEPITCRRLFYHEHAGRIIETTLNTMQSLLEERLQK